MYDISKVKIAINEMFPGRQIVALTDKGHWVEDEADSWRGAYVIYFTLDDQQRYCMKIHGVDAAEAVHCDLQVIALFKQHDLPAPEVVLADPSGERMGYAFHITRYQEGIRLCTLWLQVSAEEQRELFFEMGRLFSRMHAVHNAHSGLISADDPYQVRYPGVTPNGFMFGAEIKGGSGKQAVEQGYLSQANYETVIGLWEGNMDYLNDHQPSLIHFSTFCWTVSFLRQDRHWRISKLTALGDVLWWDPACNLALIRYPPCMRIGEAHWQSFLQGYVRPVDEKRVALYALLTTICAAMGTYREPDYLKNRYIREELDRDIELLIDRINR